MAGVNDHPHHHFRRPESATLVVRYPDGATTKFDIEEFGGVTLEQDEFRDEDNPYTRPFFYNFFSTRERKYKLVLDGIKRVEVRQQPKPESAAERIIREDKERMHRELEVQEAVRQANESMRKAENSAEVRELLIDIFGEPVRFEALSVTKFRLPIGDRHVDFVLAGSKRIEAGHDVFSMYEQKPRGLYYINRDTYGGLYGRCEYFRLTRPADFDHYAEDSE